MKYRLSFWQGAAIELSLLGLAVALAWVMTVPIWDAWHWDWLDFGRGLAGTMPMLLLFWWLMRTNVEALRRIREFIKHALLPVLEGWSVARLLSISVLAGVSEEFLFRGVLQGWLEGTVGPATALVLASAVFGVCHWITPAYALVAALMGVYLGGLWWWSGNLLTPVVAHACYDFLALVWLLRFQRR
jgi:hypothetical protein